MNATAAVKAEIKTWERDFRSQNGRNATVDDIKALPRIAEKYKLYKKLTKEADAMHARSQQAPEPPKTPPRTRPSKSDTAVAVPILQKPCAMSSTSHAQTNNPFSPAKRKAMNAVASSSKVSTNANPFLTPVKAKHEDFREPSPPLTPVPTLAAAVNKARKRLRGEPVSPSPQPREKRQRVRVSNLSSRGARVSRSPNPHSEAEVDSFLDDSPVKTPANGKAFEPIFQEASTISFSQPTLQNTVGNKNKVFARAKTLPIGLFGNTKKGPIPSKDNLSKAKPPVSADTSSIPPHNSNSSRKRSLSASTTSEKDVPATFNSWDLLPPSPPPPDDSYWRQDKGKGKIKPRNISKGKSKKAKLSGRSDDEVEDKDSSSESAEVKVVPWRGRPQSPRPKDGGDTPLELDPELQFHLRGRRYAPLPPASPTVERFEVDLPEDMRRVLALSPGDGEREKEEEELVKELIQGLRKGRGEVWGPGEVGTEGDPSDGDPVIEDDWEGEGVPWEVAEL